MSGCGTDEEVATNSLTKSEIDRLWYFEQMFPRKSRSYLLAVMRTTNSNDEAEKRILIETKEAEAAAASSCSYKRIRLMSDSSEESMSPLTKKRPRVLSQISDPDSQQTHISITTVKKSLQELPDNYQEKSDSSGDEEEEEDVIVRSKSKQVQLLDFFNNSTDVELQRMGRCSSKKSDQIIELRPYENWSDLLYKFGERRAIGFDTIDYARELLNVRKVVTDLMERCQKMSNSMSSHVEMLFNSKIEQLEINKQPAILNSKLKLKEYQMVGLNWLLLMYQNEMDGILADEMGLGKTAQSIAFLSYLYEIGITGPHLIIVPSSTLDNWAAEIAQWCPTLSVCIYHGKPEDRAVLRDEIFSQYDSYNIILSTYSVLTSSVEDKHIYKRLPLEYVVIDEAHMLKNMTTARYKNLMKIQAKRRLLLTGTPFQNDLVELMSLLCFVMPDMFINKEDELKRMFVTITTKSKDGNTSFELDRIDRAKNIMKPFVLRRLKVDVLKELPKKFRTVEKLDLSSEQEEIYADMARKCLRKSSDDGQNECVLKIGYISKFRLCSSHHLLMRHRYHDKKLRKLSKLILTEPTHHECNEQYVFEDMQAMSDFELDNFCRQYGTLKKYQLNDNEIYKSSKIQYLDNALPKIKSKGEKVLIFTQFQLVLSVLEKYLTLRDHKYMRLDGATPVQDRLSMINEFNSSDTLFVFILSTRAGGLGINLASANHVIMFDIDFNPHNDRQAEDRAHRLGQERDVYVTSLITKNTVEEAMLHTATKKLKLEQQIQEDKKKSKDQEKEEEMKVLKETLMIWNNSQVNGVEVTNGNTTENGCVTNGDDV